MTRSSKLARARRAASRPPIAADADGRAALRAMADGDGRFLLNLVEEIDRLPPGPPLGPPNSPTLVQRRAPLYDKAQEGHYNLISALHKSLRGSDTDAALYWLARMLAGGEDPIYILRRLTRAAVEDIGLADPQALAQALAAWDTYDRLGSPEGELAVAQLVIYLATAPKSNAAYVAFGEAQRMARETGSLMPPMHILNAPTRLMRNLGYGKGYVYDHATEEGFSGQNYFPDGIARREFLPARRARLRARDQEAARILGQIAPARRSRARSGLRRRLVRCTARAMLPGHRGGLEDYFPDGIARRNFYRPGERGFRNAEVKKRLEYWDKLRQRAAISPLRPRGRRGRGEVGDARALANTHLTLPALRAGPLPLPPEGRRGESRRRYGQRG